jgi:hypothetical protein
MVEDVVQTGLCQSVFVLLPIEPLRNPYQFLLGQFLNGGIHLHTTLQADGEMLDDVAPANHRIAGEFPVNEEANHNTIIGGFETEEFVDGPDPGLVGIVVFLKIEAVIGKGILLLPNDTAEPFSFEAAPMLNHFIHDLLGLSV